MVNWVVIPSVTLSSLAPLLEKGANRPISARVVMMNVGIIFYAAPGDRRSSIVIRARQKYFWPLVHGGRREGLLSRLFGRIEVAKEPYQCGDDSAPIGAINRIQGRGDILGHSQS